MPPGDDASWPPNAIRSPSNPNLGNMIRQATRLRHAQEKSCCKLHTTAATKVPIAAPERNEELALYPVVKTV